METAQLPPSSFTIIAVVVLCLTVLLAKKLFKPNPITGLSNPIPGPPTFPIIGSIHHLAGSLPHRKLAKLAKIHGPVMLLRLGQVDLITITSPEAAEDVLKTHDRNFASRPKLAAARVLSHDFSNIVLSPYGAYWRQIRKVCTMELLTARRVRSFSSIRREEVSNLVHDLSVNNDGKAIDVSGELVSLSNSITFRAVIGKRCRQQQGFLCVMKEATALVSGFSVADLFPWLEKVVDLVSGLKFKIEMMHVKLNAILDEVIHEHEAHTAISKDRVISEEEDLLAVLLRLRDQKELEIPLTNSNIKAIILDLFAAGTDTSTTVMEWAMSELVRNPKMMEKAQSEVRNVMGMRTMVEETDICEFKFLREVITETMRLHPPGSLIIRMCKENCSVQGYPIQAGCWILVNLWALSSDPNRWRDADEFKPKRFEGSSVDFKGADFSFMPFGSGRRMCPGIAFGIANVDLILAQLLHSFDWKLPDGMRPDELDMTEAAGVTSIRKSRLHLIPVPRSP